MSFGVNVTTRTARASGGSQPRTGTLFLCGPAAVVPAGLLTLYSIADFEAFVGVRSGATIPSWDAVESFFAFGGSKIMFAGYDSGSGTYGDALAKMNDPKYGPGQIVVVGTGPAATVVPSAPSAPVPTTANTGGTIPAGVYTVAVSYTNATGETLASTTGTVTTTGSSSTLTVPSPIAASGATGYYAYVSQVGGSSLTRQQPAGGPTPLGTSLVLTAPPTSTGAAPLTTATVNASSSLFADMQTSAKANNRVALRDVIQGATVAQMAAQGLLAPPNDEYGATFGPWLNVPPPPGVIGAAARQVPYSIAIAALCAQVDASGNPNRAAAGDDYPLYYATGMSTPVGFADRSTLFAAGVNAPKDEFGLENYGFQTNIAQSPSTPYWQFNCSRARMALVDAVRQRARKFMFRPLDGRGKIQAALKAAIEDECSKLYAVDAMYGLTPSDAYAVNVSASVNTQATIAAAQLHAVTSVVWSPHTRAVDVDLVTVPLGSPVQ